MDSSTLPPPEKKFPKKYLRFLLVVSSVILVFGGYLLGRYSVSVHREKIIEENNVNNDVVDFEPNDLIVATGVIRSNGLNKTDKEKFDLNNTDFQVTNLENKLDLNVHGYFLTSNDFNSLLGKCVQIIGYVPDGWRKEDINHTALQTTYYNRRSLVPISVALLPFQSCKPYHDFDRVETEEIQGLVTRTTRDIPFNNQDYEIKVDGDILDRIGFADRSDPFKLILWPANNQVWAYIENEIDKEAVLIGYTNKSGYSKNDKSGYFMVTDVRSQVIDRKLPLSIYPEQISNTYSFENIDFALYQKSNFNIPISRSGKSSGILYAHQNDSEWKEFTKIQETGTSKNNPYLLDHDSGRYYVLVVDTNGAGSGEGIGKLLSLKTRETNWKLESCFYYLPELDLENFEISKLKDSIIGNQKINKYGSEEDNCSDFTLIQHTAL